MAVEFVIQKARIVGEYHFHDADAAFDSIDEEGFDVPVTHGEEVRIGGGEGAEDGDIASSCAFFEQVDGRIVSWRGVGDVLGKVGILRGKICGYYAAFGVTVGGERKSTEKVMGCFRCPCSCTGGEK